MVLDSGKPEGHACFCIPCRFAESRGIQDPEQRCVPALSGAAGGEEEPAGEEQQTYVALSGERSTPSAAGHQGEVGHIVTAAEAHERPIIVTFPPHMLLFPLRFQSDPSHASPPHISGPQRASAGGPL